MQIDHSPTATFDLQTELALKERELRMLRERITQLEETVAQRSDALRRSDERYQLIVTAAPLVLAAFDMDGKFTLSEGKGLEKLGLKPGQVVGLSVHDMYKDFPEIIAAVKRCLSGESVDMVAQVGPLAFQSQ
jgi:PAS domain-containing protein